MVNWKIRYRLPLVFLFLSAFGPAILGASSATVQGKENVGTRNSHSSFSDSLIRRGFFPYHYCTACTIIKASKDSEGRILATFKIDEVLTGKNTLAVGGTYSVVFNEPDKTFLPATKMAKGTKCVFAFNAYQEELDGPLQSYNCYAPFPFQRFSNSDIQALRAKLPALSQDDNCILCTLDTIENGFENNQSAFVKATFADAFTGILKDCVKTKTKLEITIPKILNSNFSIQSLEETKGKQCLLTFTIADKSFNRNWLATPRKLIDLRVSNLRVIRPPHGFTKTEIAGLKSRWESAEHAKTAATKLYLEKIWTVERIKNYCRPEARGPATFTICPIGGPDQYLYPNYKQDMQLHTAAESTLGRVFWNGIVSNGTVEEYFLTIVKGHDIWRTSNLKPSLIEPTDDDFILERLRMSVRNTMYHFCSANPEYYRANIEEFIELTGPASKRLIRSSTGTIEAMEIIRSLPNSETITVELGQNQSLKAVLLNGVRKPIFDKVFSDASVNYDRWSDPRKIDN